MSDKFGRHKSTRWVKASVPSYGDEWDDDYNQGFDDSDEERLLKEEVKASVAEQRFELPSQRESLESHDHEADNVKEIVVPKIAAFLEPSDLVLSIDRFNTRDSDSGDSDLDTDGEFKEQGEDVQELNDSDEHRGYKEEIYTERDQSVQHEPESNHPKGPASLDVYRPDIPADHELFTPTNEAFAPDIHTPAMEPPHRSFSDFTPETPTSDRSFQSDADSIQREPATLNVFNNHQQDELPVDLVKEDEEVDTDTELGSIHEYKNEVLKEMIPVISPSIPHETSPVPNSAPEPDASLAPLVLSIDNRHNDSSDENDNDIDSDDWGYQGEESDDEVNENPGKTDALDSLIKDLQNASMDLASYQPIDEREGAEKYVLPQLDSLQSINLPEFDDSSLNNYNHYSAGLNIDTSLIPDDDESAPTTPIAPLSTADERRGHESYISGHKSSIRKPPPRKDLVSVDYSNIADAVSGYLSGGEKSDVDQNLNAIEEDQNAEDSTDEKGVEETYMSDDLAPEPDYLKLPNLELNPVASSGSLSTGNRSVSTFKSSQYDEPEISRRSSTMSTNTVNMGGWKPNTSNFRDQFINDNDNESHLSFTPDDEVQDFNNYNKFTKVRTASGLGNEIVSDDSSDSLPETIDAALPSINEDPDDDEDIQSPAINTTVSNIDSVLGEHSYPLPVFKEEKMTPLTSKENLPPVNKYSSLLPPVEARKPSDSSESSELSKGIESETSSDTRVLSINETIKDTRVTSGDFTPKSYPVYDWKKIMATSQPIDRIRLLKEALEKEAKYDTGLQHWLNDTLKQSDSASTMHIGRIASEAYLNATHSDIRRHASIRSKVSIVKDKVENSGLHASSFGKRFLSRGKKLMKGGE